MRRVVINNESGHAPLQGKYISGILRKVLANYTSADDSFLVNMGAGERAAVRRHLDKKKRAPLRCSAAKSMLVNKGFKLG